MLQMKHIRDHGKIRLSQYFNTFETGDRITVVRELSLAPQFPKKLQGRSGVVIGRQGTNYIVKIKDIAKEKKYIVHPAHLRKLKQ